MCILLNFVESRNSGKTFQQNVQTINRGGAQGRRCIAPFWHMHTHASRQSLIWWGHTSYCGSCTTACHWRWISPFSQPHYTWNCTAATHAVCYTLTPWVSPFDAYNILHIAKNLGMRLALWYICVDQPETEDEFTLEYTFTHIHSYLITRYKNTHGILKAARWKLWPKTKEKGSN